MSRTNPTLDDENNPPREPSVDALANQALSVLAARRHETRSFDRATQLRDLFDAAVEPDGARIDAVVREMLRGGIASEVVSDVYVPEVARQLGNGWMTDRLGFAEVSIGTSRLQRIVRQLAGEADPLDDAAARVAVVVPLEEDHTLGAIILAGQLRRFGVGVSLHIGEPHEQIGAALHDDPPVAVLISSSSSCRLGQVARILETARDVLGKRVPCVLGGSILDTTRPEDRCVGERLHEARDLPEALAACRIDMLCSRGTRVASGVVP